MANSWSRAENPHKFQSDLVTSFDSLPLSGKVNLDQKKFWSGYYWPNNKGSVGFRWTKLENIYEVGYLNQQEVMELDKDDIALLSPIEKFDLYKSEYRFIQTKKAKRFYQKNALDWKGLCHGMAAAAINHPEPNIKKVINKEGVEITFYSSDIKAILAYTYSLNSSKGARILGQRCNRSSVHRRLGKRCQGINAGTFHLLLTNLIGKSNTSFIVDIDRYEQVWNHFILGYESNFIIQSINKVTIKTILKINRIIDPSFGPNLNTSNDRVKELELEYSLSLNSIGEIVGGQWISEQRIDFIWNQRPLKLDNEVEFLLK